MSQKTIGWGLLLTASLATIAWQIGQHIPLIGGPVFALFLGLLVGIWHKNRHYTQAGILFSAKTILQFAVVLLGFGLHLKTLLTVGANALPVILTSILTAFLLCLFLYKPLGLQKKVTILIAVGSAICGGSAIAATAPVIEAKTSDISKAISVIFFFNLLAALLFPSLGQILGLSESGFALFAGTAVNDTSSVTATATAWDNLHHSNSLEQATVIKLTRTLAIIPITLGLSLYQTRFTKKTQEKRQLSRAFPKFIPYFLVASLITTLFVLPPVVIDTLKWTARFLITMAMAAVGLNTNIKEFVTSYRAILLGGLAWLAISIATLSMQALLGLW